MYSHMVNVVIQMQMLIYVYIDHYQLDMMIVASFIV